MIFKVIFCAVVILCAVVLEGCLLYMLKEEKNKAKEEGQNEARAENEKKQNTFVMWLLFAVTMIVMFGMTFLMWKCYFSFSPLVTGVLVAASVLVEVALIFPVERCFENL